MENRKILLITGIFIFGCISLVDSKTYESHQKVIINKISNKLSQLQLNDKNTFKENVIYSDTVTFIGYEDIGDYSRLVVEKDKIEYYFLYDPSPNEDIITGDKILINWCVVENHAIEDPENTYLDILIKSFDKLK